MCFWGVLQGNMTSCLKEEAQVVSLSHVGIIMIQKHCYIKKRGQEVVLRKKKKIEKQKVTGGEMSDQAIKKQEGE